MFAAPSALALPAFPAPTLTLVLPALMMSVLALTLAALPLAALAMTPLAMTAAPPVGQVVGPGGETK